MLAKYFQGNSVQGEVSASPAQNFRQVVDALRICPTLKINRDAFIALPERERNKVKQVPFFVPATFRQSPSKRNYENALHANLIFLDIDPEKIRNTDGKWVETGRYPAAPFVRDPQLILDALRQFNCCAHHTASSTPEKPRMRIVVDAEGIPLSEYPKAVATIGALLGLPSITRESTVAVQPMFLPTLFHDSPADYSPVICLNLEGRPFRLSDISDSLDSYHGANGTNGTNGHKPHANQGNSESDGNVDALEYLKAPDPNTGLALAREALFTVDADCSYHEWLDMAAALRHQFSRQEEEAYALFDEWSSKGSKYAGDKETRAKWKSLKASPTGRLPITIRSLLRKAQEHGWKGANKIREHGVNALLQWYEEAEDIITLLDTGTRRIVAVPLISTMQEDMLVSGLCAAAKRRFSQTISTTAVRKDLQKIKAEVARHTEQPAAFNEKWAVDMCYIIAADEFFRYRTGEKIKTQAFNAAYGRFLMPTKAQREASDSPAGECTPLARPSDYALHKLQITTVQDYAYDPAQPSEKFFYQSGSRLVNVYQPTYPLPDPKNATMAGKMIMNHLEHLIAEPEYRRLLVDFMAYQVQAPGRKIRWAVLLQSVEGAGKTFLAEVMKAVLGTEHVKVIDGASIKSGWNEWSFGKQVIVIEEVRVVGTSKHEIMNALKPLVTNDDISVNERFRNNRQVRNISNYFMFSNHHDALALTPGDRRYFVLKSPLQTKEQVLALGENYFAPLYALLRDYPGAVRSWLADWEISPDFKPDGHAPRTKYVQELVNDSASELHAAIRRLLLEADFPLVQYDIVSAGVLKTALVQEEGINKVTAQSIAQILREEGLVPIGRHLIDDDRQYLWMRPRADLTAEGALADALHRHAKQLKNLGMELLY